MDLKHQFGSMDYQGISAVAIVYVALLFGCAPTISGSLTDEFGHPIRSEEGRVNLICTDGSKNANFVAPVDPDGSFEFSDDLVPGTYVVEALVPGYKMASKGITLKGSQELELQLKKIPHDKVEKMAIGVSTNLNELRGTGDANLTPPHL